MTNLGLEIFFWTILISYLGLRFNQTWNNYKQQYLRLKMKLKIKPNLPEKDLQYFYQDSNLINLNLWLN